MTKGIAVLLANLLWLALGLAVIATAAVVRVWEWKAGLSGFGNTALGLLIVGMVVASWRLAHNDAASKLQLDLRGRFLVIASINISALAVVLLTTMVASVLLDIAPEHLSMLAIFLLPFPGFLIIAALVAAYARRERT